jgi:hypothetical protein
MGGRDDRIRVTPRTVDRRRFCKLCIIQHSKGLRIQRTVTPLSIKLAYRLQQDETQQDDELLDTCNQ